MVMNIIWLVLAVVFVVLEFFSNVFISLWFIFGALAALVASFLDVSFINQVYIFLGVSLVTLFLLRPLALKFAKPKAQSNYNAIIGSVGFVTETIDNSKSTGYIKVNYQNWSAQSANFNEIIEVGDKIKVINIEGIKAIVVKEEN